MEIFILILIQGEINQKAKKQKKNAYGPVLILINNYSLILINIDEHMLMIHSISE